MTSECEGESVTSETGEFNTAFELLQRLRQPYYTVDDITKAKHMLNYHALTQR